MPDYQINIDKKVESNLLMRITALWAFSEAFLGGILHGLNIPFAGLALALIASLCISVIAVHEAKKGAIFKATLLVIAVKFVLSPNTSPMAYVAVFIQGLAGEFFFLNQQRRNWPIFVLTLFSQLYSAFQHLLILTILFGKGFWQALDLFLNKITQIFIAKPQHYSLYLVLFYLMCYLVAGVIGGIFNTRMVRNVLTENMSLGLAQAFKEMKNNDDPDFNPGKKRRRYHYGFTFYLSILLLLVLIASYLPFFPIAVSRNKALTILMRGLLILVIWVYLISPILIKMIGKWVKRYNSKRSAGIEQVIALLPDIRIILRASWKISNACGKWLHFKQFITNSLLLIIHYEP